MIPFFQVNYFIIGPLTIQVWGLFVAAGVLAGVELGRRLVRKYLLSEDIFLDIAVWVLFSALIFARLFHIVFYNLDFYLNNPAEIYRFWHGGSSSLGGFFGAVLALYVFAKLRRFTLKDYYPYLDILSLSLWLGMGIGRLGCFMIHDHPGILTDFFLAVRFPYGTRYDLGLLESLLAFAIFWTFYLNLSKILKKGWGKVTLFSFYIYSLGRFLLDFLRASDLQISDTRYVLLTPAQWGMMVIFVALTGLIFSDNIRQVFRHES